MLAKTETVALIGTDANLVQVEVDVNAGVPRFTIVGLPTKSVREAEQRVRSALETSGQRWPSGHRITANLAPGALRKDGTHFDLPMALGIAAADRRLNSESLDGWIAMGELALDGSVRSVPGALAAAMSCRAVGRRGLICPRVNAGEAALVEGIEVVPVATLKECVEFLKGNWEPPVAKPFREPCRHPHEDLGDVRGQEEAKVALELAAAGGHNLLMLGPPGCGKTMLARRLPGILPEMTDEEALEVTRIYSIGGLLSSSLITERPFRVPHHHVSMAGLIGGGSGLARPGEVSLAHRGVLFLDELTLYRRDSLDGLRAPLEDRTVRIARTDGAISFPCDFSLIAAANPCPCGRLGSDEQMCRCSRRQRDSHRSKLTGPLIDRIDLQVNMQKLTRSQLTSDPPRSESAIARGRVANARGRQLDRYGTPLLLNGSAPRAVLERVGMFSAAGWALLGSAVDVAGLTGRGVVRVMRVARTIADLEGAGEVSEDHMARSLQFRLSETYEGAAA